MEEKDYSKVFEIVAFAGNSRSASMMAVEAAREGNFEQAKEYLQEAEKDYLKAHEVQSNMISVELQNEQSQPVDLLAVHAQDHLAMATVALDYAKEFVNLYTIIQNLMKK